MTTERREAVIRSLKGWARRFVPPGEFLTDCLTILDSLKDEVADGVAVRQEIAGLLGLKEEGPEGDVIAWYALPNIRTAIAKLNGQLEEYKKLVEEAHAARAQDQQRLFHYEGALLDKGLDPNKVSPDTPTFKEGDRVIYDLGHNGEVLAEVLRLTRKRVFIRLIGRFGGVRYVGAKSLRPDPNPSPE